MARKKTVKKKRSNNEGTIVQLANGKWRAQISLIATFNKYLIPLLEDGYAIDLYALAPIPLLVQLGNLFANRPNINMFESGGGVCSIIQRDGIAIHDVIAQT